MKKVGAFTLLVSFEEKACISKLKCIRIDKSSNLRAVILFTIELMFDQNRFLELLVVYSKQCI